MKKRILLLALVTTCFLTESVFSQENDIKRFNLSFDARADFELNKPEEDVTYGFVGKNLNIMFNGEINDHFSVKVRQRLNKPINAEVGFFNATDIATLTWNINKKFSIVAGKQVVSIGGFEYDLAPIDLYFYSDFTNNIPSCYEFGVAANYTVNNDLFSFQMINSPFATNRNGKEGLFAYNLIWYGSHGIFNSIYSLNMMEYRKGKFVNYVTLGNQFNIGALTLEIDFQNRTFPEKFKFLTDYSLIGTVKYKFNGRWSIFAKGGYDRNDYAVPIDTQNPLPADAQSTLPDGTIIFPVIQPNGYVVQPDTEYIFAGTGVEFFPIKDKKDIRIHAFGAISNDSPLFNIGLTWRIKAI